MAKKQFWLSSALLSNALSLTYFLQVLNMFFKIRCLLFCIVSTTSHAYCHNLIAIILIILSTKLEKKVGKQLRPFTSLFRLRQWNPVLSLHSKYDCSESVHFNRNYQRESTKSGSIWWLRRNMTTNQAACMLFKSPLSLNYVPNTFLWPKLLGRSANAREYPLQNIRIVHRLGPHTRRAANQ